MSDIFTRFTMEPRISSVSPASAARGATLDVTITGTGFLTGPDPSVQMGTGIVVNRVSRLSATQLSLNITIPGTAAPGSRDVRVTNPGTGPGSSQGASDLCERCFAVT